MRVLQEAVYDALLALVFALLLCVTMDERRNCEGVDRRNGGEESVAYHIIVHLGQIEFRALR